MDSQNPSDPKGFDRRDFLKLGAASGLGFLTGSIARTAEAATPKPAPDKPAMPTRNLGRTGQRVGIFSLGGQSAIEQANNADVAVPIIERRSIWA